MSRFEAQPGIVTNGLVLNLDAGDPDSYTRSQPPYVEVLVVAGGGAGGGNLGGGGGAGGVIYNSAYQLTNATAVTVTVGAGGPGVTGTQAGVYGDNGSNSVFGSLTAIGGGGAGSGTAATIGRPGGSGGGASGYSAPTTPGGAGTPGQGFNGGNGGGGSPYYGGGGGGGAGENGGTGIDGNSALAAGDGGDGLPFSILGTTYYFGGGGGGGVYYNSNAGDGGLGGGGGGGAMNAGYEGLGGGSALNDGERGTGDGTYPGFGLPGGGNGGANTGGGGGGAQHQQHYGGNGGSGIVVVRYPGLPAATGGTITYLNGYTIHTFTSSGTFTPYLWNDVSGNGYNSTLVNGIAFIPNVTGGYLNFDGVDDSVDVPGAGIPSTSTTNEISVCFWSYGVSETTAGSIIETRDSGGSRVINVHLPWSNNIIYWDSPVRITYSLSAGQSLGWHYWSFTRDPSTGISAIYQDGTLLTLGNPGSTSIVPSTSARIGSYATGGSNFYPGRIGVAQIYNRALSQNEIAQNYNAQRARFGLPYVATSGLGSSGNPATSAQQLYDNGISQDGVYYINNGTTTVPTYCEFKNGEGWMLVMNIKSDYFGDSKLTWNDYNNWINTGENLGTVFNPFLGGQYRNRDLYNYMPNEKWMIKVHNNGSEFGGGSWAAWELIEPGNTMVTIMNTPGASGGGTQVTNDYYAQVGMGTSGYAPGLFWCPIARTLGHLRVNHLLSNNGARILGSEQYLETSNTDRTRGLSNHYAIAGTALDNQGLSPWNSHVSPYVNTANTPPYSSNYRQFTTTVFPDSSNYNTATNGTVTLSDGKYMHYGIFIK